MPANGFEIDTAVANDTAPVLHSPALQAPAFTGLDGVDALVNSPALEILRGLGHGPELAALMKLAQIVEEQEAALARAA